jgi:hypothetical protein
MPTSSQELAPTDQVIRQEYFDVILRADGIVWLRRTEVIYPSIEAVHEAYGSFLKVVDDWLLDRRIKSGVLGTKAKTPSAWLYDLRSAPVRRNDPEFEKVIQERRADLVKRSPAIVVLVKTASGKMQVTRLARTGNASLSILDNFDDAIATLKERLTQEF